MFRDFVIFLMMVFLLGNVQVQAEDLIFKKVTVSLIKGIDLDDLIDDEGDINELKVDGNGNVFINFMTSAKIYKIDNSLKRVINFNKNGQGPDEMIPPVSFLINDGKIEVTDRNSTRFAQYTSDGKVISYYSVGSGIAQWFFKSGNNIMGIDRIPAKIFDKSPTNLITSYLVKKDYLKKDKSFFLIKPIGDYLANQLSDYLLVDDSLLFITYRYLDKIVKLNLNTYKMSDIGSPLKLHLKSPSLGKTTVKIKKDGGKISTYGLSGDEYICYTSLIKFKKNIAGLFWKKQLSGFSLSELFSGKDGGRIINFFDYDKPKYAFSIKLPFPVIRTAYSPKDNIWYSIDASYKLKKFKIKGL